MSTLASAVSQIWDFFFLRDLKDFGVVSSHVQWVLSTVATTAPISICAEYTKQNGKYCAPTPLLSWTQNWPKMFALIVLIFWLTLLKLFSAHVDTCNSPCPMPISMSRAGQSTHLAVSILPSPSPSQSPTPSSTQSSIFRFWYFTSLALVSCLCFCLCVWLWLWGSASWGLVVYWFGNIFIFALYVRDSRVLILVLVYDAVDVTGYRIIVEQAVRLIIAYHKYHK